VHKCQELNTPKQNSILMKNSFLIFGLLFMFKFAVGQVMITDFLYKDGDKSSSPSNFVEFNQKMFLEATTESFGREIWVTEGNVNEAIILKDINPGKNSGIHAFSESSVIINNTLYFIANDGNSIGEIWKTDGTAEGTQKVTNFLNSNISRLTLIGEHFYFLIKKNDLLQVWISDGSYTGTRIVKDNLPIWNSITFQGKCNNTFIFTFQPYGSNSCKVWRSDGTSDGTYPITMEISGNGAGSIGSSALSQYIEFNNELYFVSRDYLHKTDGTLDNTVIITSLYSAETGFITFADVIEANEKLYFSFFKVDNYHLFIWESDGTESGSNKIYDESGNRYFTTSNLLGMEDALIFCGVNNTGGTSLLNLSLTDYSVSHIKELQDSIEKPFIFSRDYDLCKIQKINENKIFCSSPIDSYQRKGWFSELTEETTINIENLDNVINIFRFNGSLYFSKNTDLEGYELWKSDGTEDNIFLLDNINKSKYGMSNKPLISLNSDLIFTANNGVIGDEMWKYNGTTTLLKDIREGPSGSFSDSFIEFDNHIFFVSNDSIHGIELWKTNGTQSGTKIAHDIIEGAERSYPRLLRLHKGILYFIVYKDNHYHLCKSNGSDFELIKDLGENAYGVAYRVLEMISSGDFLYFITTGSGQDLWISDGTESGTSKLKDFYSCNNLTDVNGKLFFISTETFNGNDELWITEGSESNTKLVKVIGDGYSSKPKDLINFNGVLFFTAFTNECGRELWKSDGSDAGTIQIVDLNPGSQNSFVNANFCITDNTMYFSANNGEKGFELWKTDGSEHGTVLVKDINSGVEGSFPNQLVAINNLIYFEACNTEYGAELWKSDGTELGTLMVSDIQPGNLSSSPSNIISIDNDVFFIAEATDNGRQIWKVPFNTIISIPVIFSETDLKVYPNPCVDFVNFNSVLRLENICIYNLHGQLIGIEQPGNNSINISHLPSGLYILRFNFEGKALSRLIIKK